MHKPDQFGDDLSAIRPIVTAVNRQKQTLSGIEAGRHGIAIRGLSPLFVEGRHIGSVEFGTNLRESLVKDFSHRHGVQMAVHVADGGQLKLLASTLGDRGLLDMASLQRAMNGATITTHGLLDERPHTIEAYALHGIDDRPVGVIEFGIDSTPFMERLRNDILMMIGMGAIMLILGTTAAFLLGRQIARPLARTARAMEEIASVDGDLTRRLPENHGFESAILAKAFNRFVGKVHGTINEVAHSTVQLASAAEEFSAITRDTRTIVESQSHETGMLATAMTEMTATIQQVAQNAAQAAQAASQTNQLTHEGQREVLETVSAIEALAGQVERMVEIMRRLEQDSEQVGSVVEVIRSIAEQTNLLALNAAIEAARAGEQGRGFAVVADEVRTLASKTQASTEEIRRMIETLQIGARSAAESMQQSQEQAQLSVSRAERAGDALKSITESAGSIAGMNQDIAHAAKQQSQVAEEINRNLLNISQQVERTAEGSRQTSLASEELARLGTRLQSLVSQFRL